MMGARVMATTSVMIGARVMMGARMMATTSVPRTAYMLCLASFIAAA
jgi:hypothetical protein